MRSGGRGGRGYWLRKLSLFVILCSGFLCAGCGSYLIPASGPNSVVVRSGATWNGPQYGRVRLTADSIRILEEYGPRTLTATFGDHRPPPEIVFGIGDVVSVTIFEAAAGGLFIPAKAGVRPGNFVTLPNQPVDTKGFISVPYAGLVPTAGKTPAEVEAEIVGRIKNRAMRRQQSR
jgi:polysaccharide biosynthesis/export protein